MGLDDLVIGFFISKLFGKSGETRSPAVTFPQNGTPAPAAQNGTPAPTLPAAQPQFPAQVPVPATTPPAATPAPAQGTAAPAGFKRAVEVWIVQPRLVQQGSSVLVGMGPEVGAMAVSAIKAQFPKGWQAAKSATPDEAILAKRFLSEWKDGMVVFAHQPASAPETLANIRAFRMTKHPGTPATVPTPEASAPLPPQPQFPVQVPVPATAPAAPSAPATAPPGPAPTVTTTPSGGKVTTLPETLITADAPAAPAPTAQPVAQITAVRRGEGLANVAKRLGQPATGTSATVLQRANVPGPDGWFSAQSLDKGGLKKKNRAGGLQPGDRLFVPPQWGPVDPVRL